MALFLKNLKLLSVIVAFSNVVKILKIEFLNILLCFFFFFFESKKLF